jgi:hypothetical protein
MWIVEAEDKAVAYSLEILFLEKLRISQRGFGAIEERVTAKPGTVDY